MWYPCHPNVLIMGSIFKLKEKLLEKKVPHARCPSTISRCSGLLQSPCWCFLHFEPSPLNTLACPYFTLSTSTQRFWSGYRIKGYSCIYVFWCMLPLILEIEHTGASSLRKGMACEQQIIYWFSIWMHLCEWMCLFASYGWNKNRIDTFKIAKFYTLQIICQPNVACLIPILSWNFLSNTTNFPKVTGT